MKTTTLALVISASFMMVPVLALAESQTSGLPPSQTSGLPSSQTSGSGSGSALSPSGSYSVPNPLNVSSFCGLIKALLAAAIAIGIPIAVLFIVYAGFKFVLARGKPEALAEARSNFLWTIVGIGIFLAAWLLAGVIANTVNALQAGTGGTSFLSCR